MVKINLLIKSLTNRNVLKKLDQNAGRTGENQKGAKQISCLTPLFSYGAEDWI